MNRSSFAEAGDDVAAAWAGKPLWQLIAFITGRHHTLTRNHIRTVDSMTRELIEKHGSRHPELASVRAALESVGHDLQSHMAQEEQILFPWLSQLEASMQSGRTLPTPFFGSVASLLTIQEHEPEEQHLREIQSFSLQLLEHETDCDCFERLHQELTAFASDLREHIRLEKEVLFRRALVMEEAAQTSHRRNVGSRRKTRSEHAPMPRERAR